MGKNREEANQFCEKLRKDCFFSRVTPGEKSFKDGKNWFRFQEDEEINEKTLNVKRIWILPKRKKRKVFKEIFDLIEKMISSHLFENQNKINLLSIQKSVDFKLFERKVCEFQTFQLEDLKENKKKSFFISFYFVLLFHISVLHPQRFPLNSLFSNQNYLIGKYFFNLEDIQDGVKNFFFLFHFFIFDKIDFEGK